MNMLSAEKLSICYGNGFMFKEIEFVLKAGESLSIRGANGAGKTTLLRLIAGLKKPDIGGIFWNQSSIHDNLNQYVKNIAFLGHFNGLKPHLTPKENLSLFSQVYKANITPALRALRIFSLTDIPVRLLSSGQKRRVALARLLLAPAKIWLLDEPSVGLDKETLANLDIIFEAFQAKGGMIIASTHVTLPLKFNQTLYIQPNTLTPQLRV